MEDEIGVLLGVLVPVPGVDCGGIIGDAETDDGALSAPASGWGSDELEGASDICIGEAGGEEILGCVEPRATRSLS
jgi:hypothetical protein